MSFALLHISIERVPPTSAGSFQGPGRSDGTRGWSQRGNEIVPQGRGHHRGWMMQLLYAELALMSGYSCAANVSLQEEF